MAEAFGFGGRPAMPAPGAPTPERRVARIRSHARRLVWCAIVLIGVAAAVGYFYGNLPAPFENWMLVAAASAVVFFLVLLPFLAWLSRTYTITTRRVIERSGLVATRRREIAHARGYTVTERRGPLQRLWGAGTLHLSDGVEETVVMRNIPAVRLVREVLADQLEVTQILAHRDRVSTGAFEIPPRPPLPAR